LDLSDGFPGYARSHVVKPVKPEELIFEILRFNHAVGEQHQRIARSSRCASR